MIWTKSLIDCLHTSFWRIRSRRSSKIRPIWRSCKWLGLSLWKTAYVPLLGGSSPDVVQDVGPIHKIIQMIGTESLMDCLHTSFGRIRSRRSSKNWTYPKVMQMIGTESLIDCLRTSFGRIRSRRSSKVWPIHKVIQIIGTESLMDCLRTSFGRIRSRRSSRVRPIQRLFRWMGPSLQ